MFGSLKSLWVSLSQWFIAYVMDLMQMCKYPVSCPLMKPCDHNKGNSSTVQTRHISYLTVTYQFQKRTSKIPISAVRQKSEVTQSVQLDACGAWICLCCISLCGVCLAFLPSASYLLKMKQGGVKCNNNKWYPFFLTNNLILVECIRLIVSEVTVKWDSRHVSCILPRNLSSMSASGRQM